MVIDPNDEIFQDFLVEAGEILEQLGEQLVMLEHAPEDGELLNAIFRGFHTVKGGAGFLGIAPLVDLCHQAEEVFNVLRQGRRKADSVLMDAVLKALDELGVMMESIHAGKEPAPADPALLEALRALARPGDVPAQSESRAAAPESRPEEYAGDAVGAGVDPVEREFEAFLQQAATGERTEPEHANAGAVAVDGEITEEEFEKLLDVLHGPSGAPGKKASGPDDSPGGGAVSGGGSEAFCDQFQDSGRQRGDPARDQDDPAGNAGPQPACGLRPRPPAGRPKQVNQAEHKGYGVESTVRVDTQRLDEIMNMVGELVLVRNRFKTLRSVLNDEEVAKAVTNLDVVTSDLQLAVMKTRMQPIKRVFGRFPRVVRDLARSLNKEVRLETRGEETDLDKNLVEALADPLVHLVRNAVDHGIEMPDERVRAGKPREGLVMLSAAQEGDRIELTIEDDGRGMDPDALRRSAVEKGLMDEETAARLDDHECLHLIFTPGFSTKVEISDVSGRGVGMDVVKTRINQMNGTVEIDSARGQGTRITIKIPLTLAIMPTLMVRLDGQAFALPLSSVIEILDLDLGKTNVVDGQEVVIVRNRALPLFYLKDWLVRRDRRESGGSPGHVVVVNAGGRQVGFVVDHLIGQEEVVIKALGANLNGLDGLAGATITGDGMIALILDVPGLMKKYAA